MNLACVANAMFIQTENGDLNGIRTSDARARSNPCLKCGELGHFHEYCHMFTNVAQTGDNIHTVISQVTYTLTANSPASNGVLKSIPRELVNVNVAKGLKSKVSTAVAAPITTDKLTVTSLAPAITTITIAIILKELQTTPATKPKVAVPSTSANTTGKTTGITSHLTKIQGVRKKVLNCKHQFRSLRHLILAQKLKVSLNQ